MSMLSQNNLCSGITRVQQRPKNSSKPSQHSRLWPLFSGTKGVLLIGFMEPEMMITSKMYCETLSKLGCAIQNRQCGMLKSGTVLFHNNSHPHTAAHTTQKFSNSSGNILSTLRTARTFTFSFMSRNGLVLNGSMRMKS